jgi:hypothetical protein
MSLPTVKISRNISSIDAEFGLPVQRMIDTADRSGIYVAFVVGNQALNFHGQPDWARDLVRTLGFLADQCEASRSENSKTN